MRTSRNWNERHLDGEELVDVLYETAPRPAHLDGCLHCVGRLQSLDAKRRASAEVPALDARALARQRAAIYSRLDEKPGFAGRWLWAGVPLAAAAALLMTVDVSSLVTSEQPPVAAVQNASADDALYSDLYQTLSQDAPAGVYTVAGMFDTAAAQTESYGKN